MAVAPEPARTLEARGMVVRFGGLVAIDRVDLTLAQGEILGLIGPNGAGKTTLVNALSGFQRLSEGTVLVTGRNITRHRPYRRSRAGIVRTFQAVRLFRGLTVLENVEAGLAGMGYRRTVARARALEAIDWVGLADKAKWQAGRLPYGDERRLGIARAIAMRPHFLMLDEPAAGLNGAEADDLIRLVRRIRDSFGCGLMIIEHNMPVIMGLCDRVHVLNGGVTIAVGSPAQIQADAEVRRAYLGNAR
jgi:branched-chain amino acid transport system ATP-binding protein